MHQLIYMDAKNLSSPLNLLINIAEEVFRGEEDVHLVVSRCIYFIATKAN